MKISVFRKIPDDFVYIIGFALKLCAFARFPISPLPNCNKLFVEENDRLHYCRGMTSPMVPYYVGPPCIFCDEEDYCKDKLCGKQVF